MDSEFRLGSHFMALRGNSIGRFVFHREFFLVMDPLGTRYFLDVQTRVIVAGNVKSSNIAIIWRKVKKSFVQFTFSPNFWLIIFSATKNSSHHYFSSIVTPLYYRAEMYKSTPSRFYLKSEKKMFFAQDHKDFTKYLLI